jgi:hypothetical protein
MRFLTVYFFLIYYALSCSDRANIKMIVKNELQYNIEHMILKTTGGSELFYKDLLPNELIELRIDMTDIPKTDGHYIIEYYIKDSSVVRHFGYYTNGYPINNRYDIRIQVDTILIKEF